MSHSPSISLYPSMDHSPVDIRTFYPYTPNEVKHRKRTSRAQLNVLEDHFRRDPKPNATLRKLLAEQLDMSIRGVQVWFQNRRAKEKALASKALSARNSTAIPNPSTPPDDNHTDSPHSSSALELTPHSPTESAYQSGSSAPESANNSSQSSPVTTTPPNLINNNDSSTITTTHTHWHNSPPPPLHFIPHPSATELADTQLVNLRRGSLPTYPQNSDFSLGPPFVEDLDPFGRRRSVDTSLLRLATHPYAHHARVKNGAIFGSSRFPPAPPQARFHDQPFHYRAGRALSNNFLPARLLHSAMVPHHDLVPIPSPPIYGFAPSSTTPLTPFNAVRATLPGDHPHIMSTRSVSSPLPGPLPSPGFSFGAAADSPPQIPSPVERDSPDPMSELNAFTFSRRMDDPDTEDDATSASYDAFSRFGSIASLAGSESSNTSAQYSDVGSCELGYNSDVRRGSHASGFLNMMSGLEVTPQSDGAFVPPEDLVPSSVTPIPTDRLGLHGSDGQVTTTYPSPSSTVSPGGTPNNNQENGPCFPISRSSELAFALQNSEEQRRQQQPQQGMDDPNESRSEGPPTTGAVAVDNDGPYYYEHGTMYPPVEPCSEDGGASLSMPIIGFSTDKFGYEGDMTHAAANGHFHAPIPSYATPVDGHYSTDGSFGAAATSDVYSAYNATLDPSSLENNTYT